MAEGLNRVMLIGNLGAEPELKFSQGGGAVLKLRLATNESYQTKGGERQERTEWHRVTVFGNRAEALNKILQKGKQLYVEGRISTSSYEKEGQKHYSTDIIANDIILLGGGGGGAGGGGGGGYGGGGGGGRGQRSETPRDSGPPSTGFDEAPGGAGNDDDIPF